MKCGKLFSAGARVLPARETSISHSSEMNASKTIHRSLNLPVKISKTLYFNPVLKILETFFKAFITSKLKLSSKFGRVYFATARRSCRFGQIIVARVNLDILTYKRHKIWKIIYLEFLVSIKATASFDISGNGCC